MCDRNASASAFGWEFQANSAILLMLENIKDAKCVRVEGMDEDIEITLQNQTKIYAQAKAVVNPEDTSNIIAKLEKALETLNDSAKKGDGNLYTYVTNSFNPFNDRKTQSYFQGRTHLYFEELPNTAQKKIEKIVKNKGYSVIDLQKFDVRMIPFYGIDLKNRHKEIQACINEFLAEVQVDDPGINVEIMKIWQRDFFLNATKSETSISVSKEEMIWPLIVLVVDKTTASEYKKDFDDDEIGEIERKYRMIINYNTMSYEMISRVMFGFRKSKKSPKQYVTESWGEYLDIVNVVQADNEIKESLVKIILYRILNQRKCIIDIKKGVNL